MSEIRNSQNSVVLSRSWRSLAPRFISALVISAVVLDLTSGGPLFGPQISLPIFEHGLAVTLPTALLIFLVLMSRPLFLLIDSRFEVSEHHVRASCGRCSPRKVDIELTYEEIQGVRLTQTIFERLLNVGTIFVWTAMAERPELTMGGIANPKRIVRLIGDGVDRARIGQRHANGGHANGGRPDAGAKEPGAKEQGKAS